MPKKVWEKEAERARKAAQRAQDPYGPTYGRAPKRRGRGAALPPAMHQQPYPAYPAYPQLQQLPPAHLPALGMSAGTTAAAPSAGLVPVHPQMVQQMGQGPLRVPQQGPEGAFEHIVAGISWLSKRSWRHRWQLTPAAASLGVVAGAAVDPSTAIFATALTGTAAGLAQWKGPDTIGGRTWLSRRERGITWKWAAGATAWSSGVALGVMEPTSLAGVAVLGIATGAQAVSWLRSRRIRRQADAVVEELNLSGNALKVAVAWPFAVGVHGPAQLTESQIIGIDEPNGSDGKPSGTIVLHIGLRRGVHAEQAATSDIRRWLERELEQGIGTVKLEADRDHAGRVRVILTPSRHLEKVSKVWNSPRLTEDGMIPCAITNDAREIPIRLYGATGVRHLVVIGSSNSGKSNAYNVVLTPGVLARRDVVFYVDGKGGTSSPELAPILDMVARTSAEWLETIEMVYAIMCAREARRGAMGLSKFNAAKDRDPIISLILDEGHTVATHFQKPRRGDGFIGHEAMIAAIAERGRAVGVRLGVGVQRPPAHDFPGGISARDNCMGANGNVIGLKPGGSRANSMTLASTGAEVDLTDLPAGGGWCAIVTEGELVSDRARIFHVLDEEELDELGAPADDPRRLSKHFKNFTPRSLEGEDARAAGETYANRLTGRAWADGMAAALAAAGLDATGAPISGPKSLGAPSADGHDQEQLPDASSTTITPAATDVDTATLATSTAATVAAGASTYEDQQPQPAAGSSDAAEQKILNATAQMWKASGTGNRAKILSILADNHAGVTKAGVITQLEQLDVELSERTVRRALNDLRDAGKAYEAPAGVWHAGAIEEAA